MIFLSLENSSPCQNRKPGVARLKWKHNLLLHHPLILIKNEYILVVWKTNLYFMFKRGYTCRAPLMSTEGLSPTIYSVLNWWLLTISWLETWTLSWRDDTSCLRTSSAFLNTNEFGFPKVVYSNGWGWILHIQTGGFSMVHKSHETNHHLYPSLFSKSYAINHNEIIIFHYFRLYAVSLIKSNSSWIFSHYFFPY